MDLGIYNLHKQRVRFPEKLYTKNSVILGYFEKYLSLEFLRNKL